MVISSKHTNIISLRSIKLIDKNVKELYLLKLNDEEVKVSDLKFMKVCSKCGKVSHQENDVGMEIVSRKILVSIGSTKIMIVAKLS